MKKLVPYLLNSFYSWSVELGHLPILTFEKNSLNILPESMNKIENSITFFSDQITNIIFGKEAIFFNMAHKNQQYQINYQSISKIYDSEEDLGLMFYDNHIRSFSLKENGRIFLIK